ncbi:MAG TPA: PASTA domain-containing protein [Gaiellaceae bacterium]|nr:PASTA domain-containing protein [Gaiellaceae bacterium]
MSSAANRPLAGSVDRSFGSGGIVTHNLGSNGSPGMGGFAVQPDGKILVAAGSGLLARYRPNGSLDPSFGGGGYVETHSAYPVFVRAVALQPDGKIVVAGSSSPPDANGATEFMVARYNSDGSPDTTFGADGVTSTAFPELGGPPTSAADALAILPDGRIVAAGSARVDLPADPCFPPSMFALARYTAGGALDPTFGDDGIVQTSFNGQDALAGIAVQSNGTIVASGAGDGAFCALRHGPSHVVTAPGITTIAVARYKPDGSLAGTTTTSARLNYSGGPPVLEGGKVFVTGDDSGRLVIARDEADNLVITRIKRVIGYPTAVLAQKDGKVLIAVSGNQQGEEVVRLLRTPNVRLDPSFGRGGVVSLPPSISTPALAMQRDGKVLVGGGYSNTWTLTRFIGGNNCVVPGLGDNTVSKATTTLTEAYCRRGRISRRFSSTVARGRVISTVPTRSTRLPGGTRVDLVVSKGKRP